MKPIILNTFTNKTMHTNSSSGALLSADNTTDCSKENIDPYETDHEKLMN